MSSPSGAPGLLMTRVYAPWAMLARLSHVVPGFPDRGWQRRSLPGFRSRTPSSVGAALGREALVRPHQTR